MPLSTNTAVIEDQYLLDHPLLVTCRFRHNACPVGMLHRRTERCVDWVKYRDGKMARITASGLPAKAPYIDGSGRHIV